MDTSIRDSYKEIGVDGYYNEFGDEYKNPHEFIVREHLSYFLEKKNKNIKILDLCAGSGEVSIWLLENGFKNIAAIDPYTYKNYRKRVGLNCFDDSFLDIVQDGLDDKYDLIICSFALHLCDKSYLRQLLFNLSLNSSNLLIISPHKKPEIDNYFSLEEEYYYKKVRGRFFKSTICCF